MWRIHELQQRVATALEGHEAPDGRTSAIPNVRTIRYYTTIGLLDAPAKMEGRTAYYGPRHLLQVVAIKRLQTAGHPLAAIQSRLVNLPDEDLADIAGLHEIPQTEKKAKPAKAREAFWKQPVTRSADTPVRRVEPEVVTRVRLAPGVTLLLETQLSSAQLRSVVAAAAPLVDLVESADFEGSEHE